MKIETNKGLIDIEQLVVKDETSINGNVRVTTTKWYLDGELVRADLLGNVLSGVQVTATIENI